MELDSDNEEGGNIIRKSTRAMPRRHSVNHALCFDGEVGRFNEIIVKREAAKLDIDNRRLLFERKRHDEEVHICANR